MPKLLQINCVSNILSTGTIVEDISKVARNNGWDTYVAFGRKSQPGINKEYRIGSTIETLLHYLENRLFDNEGLGSRFSTYRLIRYIQWLKPDVIHLHNIHDHYLNYRIFFSFINKKKFKVVWTFHDLWAITGHCHYFVEANCNLWESQCQHCPLQHSAVNSLIDRSYRNYILKKKIFSANENIVIVPVSYWVESIVRKSFLKDKYIRTILNGIDINALISEPKMEVPEIPDNTFVILGVAYEWEHGGRKGFDDYIRLGNLLKQDEIIVLVGIKEEQKKELPKNIIGIDRTSDKKKLANIYRQANVLLSLSSAETFGMTIIEANSLGVPAVVYNNTAPPSLISNENGFVARNKDIEDVYEKIEFIRGRGRVNYWETCRNYAKKNFDKNKNYQQYIELYNELLEQ